jgi:hypothetical protein
MLAGTGIRDPVTTTSSSVGWVAAGDGGVVSAASAWLPTHVVMMVASRTRVNERNRFMMASPVLFLLCE